MNAMVLFCCFLLVQREEKKGKQDHSETQEEEGKTEEMHGASAANQKTKSGGGGGASQQPLKRHQKVRHFQSFKLTNLVVVQFDQRLVLVLAKVVSFAVFVVALVRIKCP